MGSPERKNHHCLHRTEEILRRGEISIECFDEEGMDYLVPVLITYEDRPEGARLNRYTSLPYMQEPRWSLDRFVEIDDHKMHQTFWDHRQHMIEVAQGKGLL